MPAWISVVQDHVVVVQVPLQPDQARGVAGYARYLVPCLQRPGGAVDADHAPGTSTGLFERGEASDHAGLGAAGDGAHDDGIEEHAELRLLGLDLVGPVCEAETAELVVRGAGRYGVGLAARGFDLGDRRVPALLEPDAEARARTRRTSAPTSLLSRMLPTLS